MWTQVRSIGPSCERALVDFASRNASLLALSLSVAVVAYGYELVNFTPSLDEEVAPPFARLAQVNNWNLATYRWGMTALNFAVIDGANLPFLRLFLALCLLSVTATIYSGMLSITREARYFFALTFVTVPTFAYALTFSFLSIEIVLACLLFVSGLKLLVEAKGSSAASSRVCARSRRGARCRRNRTYGERRQTTIVSSIPWSRPSRRVSSGSKFAA